MLGVSSIELRTLLHASCLSVVTVFFFFKQKTAYEMRISDWSSDVCSSDLRDLDRIFMHFHIFMAEDFRADDRILHEILRHPAADHQKPGGPGRDLDVGQFAEIGNGKIGRASCRERVCQYV